MYVRFGAGVLLVVVLSLTGVALEKEILSTKRELSHQAYREEVLLDRHHRSRMVVQQLSAPERISEQIDAEEWHKGRGKSPNLRKKGVAGAEQEGVRPTRKLY